MRLTNLYIFFVIVLTTTHTAIASSYNPYEDKENYIQNYFIYPCEEGYDQVVYPQANGQLASCQPHLLRYALRNEYETTYAKQAYINILLDEEYLKNPYNSIDYNKKISRPKKSISQKHHVIEVNTHDKLFTPAIEEKYTLSKTFLFDDYVICIPQADINNMVRYPLPHGETGYCHQDQLADWLKNEYTQTYEKQAYIQTLVRQGYLWHSSMPNVKQAQEQNNFPELYNADTFIENYFIFQPKNKSDELVTYLKAPTNFPSATIPYDYFKKLKNNNFAQCIACDFRKKLQEEYKKTPAKQVYLYQLLLTGCLIPSSETSKACASKILTNMRYTADLSPNYNRGEDTIYGLALSPIASKDINNKTELIKFCFDNTSEESVDNFDKENNENDNTSNYILNHEIIVSNSDDSTLLENYDVILPPHRNPDDITYFPKENGGIGRCRVLNLTKKIINQCKVSKKYRTQDRFLARLIEEKYISAKSVDVIEKYNEIQKNNFVDNRTQEIIDADKLTAQRFQPKLEDIISIVDEKDTSIFY